MSVTSDSLGIIAWTRNPGRLLDIGKAFDCHPKIIDFPRLRSRRLAPLRYIISVIPTITWLVRIRPRVVIVSCPPPFAAVLVAIYARVFHATFILDAHPGAFSDLYRRWRPFVPVQRLLVRLAAVTMVTAPSLETLVSEWGGNPLVFHEAPLPLKPMSPRNRISARPKVVFTTSFDQDEPLDVVTAAACELDECDVAITGDYSRLASKFRHKLLAESHVRLTGWLDQAQYLALITHADVVVALTQERDAVMRSAFEAIYLERATVLSSTATLQACFSPSVFVENSPAAVIEGVRSVVADYESWIELMRPRHTMLIERWTSQRAALESAIAGAAKASTENPGEGSYNLDEI